MRPVALLLAAISGSLLGSAASAQQIPDRAALDQLLGPNQVFEDFESYSIGAGNSVDLSVSSLDDTTVAQGQGPGLVEPGYNESFNGTLRDQLLNGEIFYTLREAKVLLERWRRHYNQVRPHSSLGYRPPAPEACTDDEEGARLAAELRGAHLRYRLFAERNGSSAAAGEYRAAILRKLGS